MKIVACLLAAALLPACVIHVHVHEDAAKAEPVASADSTHAKTDDRITGVVRDTDGSPVAAHVALVGAAGGGSMTMGTLADGRFALPEINGSGLTLHASTADGRAAVSPVQSGARGVELVVRPGATFVVELAGREKARLAVFVEGLRVEDFTLKAGEPAKIVVPPGELRLRIYDGQTVFQERHFTARAGASESVRMQPHS